MGWNRFEKKGNIVGEKMSIAEVSVHFKIGKNDQEAEQVW